MCMYACVPKHTKTERKVVYRGAPRRFLRRSVQRLDLMWFLPNVRQLRNHDLHGRKSCCCSSVPFTRFPISGASVVWILRTRSERCGVCPWRNNRCSPGAVSIWSSQRRSGRLMLVSRSVGSGGIWWLGWVDGVQEGPRRPRLRKSVSVSTLESHKESET